MNFVKEKITRVRKKNICSIKRIYLEGKEFLKTKFLSGNRFSFTVDFENKIVKIVPYIDNKAVGKGRVSKKVVKNEIIPVLDIKNKAILEVFQGIKSCKVTIFDEEILIEPTEKEFIKYEIDNSSKLLENNIIQINTAKNISKFILPKINLDIFLKKVSGDTNFEQLSLFDTGFSLSDDNYTVKNKNILQHGSISKYLKKVLTYFEAFAGSGIGGIALDEIGMKNMGYSEIDKDAIKNYEANFPERTNFGDITKIDANQLPNFDVLIGGTPCQDVCIMKKNRKGIVGEKSCLFFDYIRILNYKKPLYFIFENVKDLLTSNNGEDFKIVKESFDKNYNIKYEVLNTANYNMPQTRRRLYIVGQRKDLGAFDFKFPNKEQLNLTVFDLLEKKVDDKYYLTQKMYDYVMSEGTKNFKQRPETDLKIARPLTATMHKMHRAGTDNYYHTKYRPKDKTNLRRLTPTECKRLQGLFENYKIVISDTQAYRLMGNAMSLNVLRKIAQKLMIFIEKNLDRVSNNLSIVY